jgi:3-deoxy-manno-octulosonate cytidylyltransferase (CMP-KDO synthetase)
MILHVLERALLARNVSRALVATDDERIQDVVRSAGYEAMLTRANHQSGSDRLAEVAARLEDVEVIVNLQGDEPLISPDTIERAVDGLLSDEGVDVSTVSEEIRDAADVLSADVVKVVTDGAHRALYFSRSPIPFPRDAVRRYGTLLAALEVEPQLLTTFRKHTGLYAYRRSFLLEYTRWPQTALERAESLEQLRALEHGATIKVVDAAAFSIGVDTEHDLQRVRRIMEAKDSCET